MSDKTKFGTDDADRVHLNETPEINNHKTGDGDDTVTGGAGITAPLGHVSIETEGGNDRIKTTGLDEVYVDAGTGNDIINVKYSPGDINGGAGDDDIKVTAGSENEVTVSGGAGNDKITVGIAKENLVFGGEGDDIITSGNSNDRLDGGDGNDILKAGGNSDILDGGKGNDTMSGGSGLDSFSITGDDTITDIAKGEQIRHDGKSLHDFDLTTSNQLTVVFTDTDNGQRHTASLENIKVPDMNQDGEINQKDAQILGNKDFESQENAGSQTILGYNPMG